MCDSLVIVSYWSELTTQDFAADISQSSAYVVELQVKATTGATAYIDAAAGGGISRFMNHSCNPSASFVERASGQDVRVLVVAERHIAAGEEVTVD